MSLVLLAGGGTGGHIYPNVAVAEHLEGRDLGTRATSSFSNRPGDARTVEQLGCPTTAVEDRPLPSPPQPWELTRVGR